MFPKTFCRSLLALLASFLLAGAFAQGSPRGGVYGELRGELWATQKGREVVFEALVDIFKDNYWNEAFTDWDAWAEGYRDEALNAPTRAAFDAAVGRMVVALDDHHSSWIGLVDNVDEGAGGEVSRGRASPGLGIVHEYLPGSGVVVRRVYPQTPAAALLQRGDVIKNVNAHDVRDANAYDVSAAFRAAVATGEVRLEVQRKRENLQVTLVPAPVRWAEVQGLPQAEMLDATTGYLYMPTFNTPRVAEEVHRLLTDLEAQGAQSLVLDLRGNLGGRLSELGLMLGAFVEGPWAQAVSREEVVWRSSYELEDGAGHSFLEGRNVFNDEVLEHPASFGGALVVLVDHTNSSAGEIAALVLQNLGRATVIGEATEGNVEAVRGFRLPDGSLVMVAVANMQSASGETFDGGVVPDVEARETLEELARGFDAPVAEALRALKRLPFTPGRFF